MNYSPVLDIKNFKESHAIGDRCYGENKEDVSKYGIEFMKELSKKGVLPVEKHFPVLFPPSYMRWIPWTEAHSAM